ncbi:hypothetical protein ACIP8Z_02510 [Streptomyces sp. NPDC088553]|uniref:hypothetical protein n=1 Tax=Streptomyces sp. NPDC088553 TaxID=3365864 RepID=UPI0037FAD853
MLTVVGEGCVPLTGVWAPGSPGLLHDRADGPVVAVALVATRAAGTAVVLRLGGLIAARGAGEGLSVLFRAQLAAVVPDQVASAVRERRSSARRPAARVGAGGPFPAAGCSVSPDDHERRPAF